MHVCVVLIIWSIQARLIISFISLESKQTRVCFQTKSSKCRVQKTGEEQNVSKPWFLIAYKILSDIVLWINCFLLSLHVFCLSSFFNCIHSLYIYIYLQRKAVGSHPTTLSKEMDSIFWQKRSQLPPSQSTPI